MFAEILGTAFFVFFFMTQTDDDRLQFSKEKVINCFIIAASYVASRGMFGGNIWTLDYGAVCNPAVSLGIFFGSIVVDAGTASKWVWLYPVMPFAGALLGLLFFELVFKKTTEIYKDEEDGEDVPEHDKGE